MSEPMGASSTGGTRMVERLLRGIALLIVVAAMVDPVLTARRPVRAVVALLSADSVRHAPVLARAERALSRVATVVRGPLPDAQAVVMVGSAWPEATTPSGTHRLPPHFVIPLATTSGVHLEAVHAPLTAQRGARSVIRARLARDAGGASAAVVVQLRDGEQLHGHHVVELAPGARQVVSLPYTPVREGVRPLRIDVIDGTDTLRHVLPMHIDSAPWRVLVFDARPSWLSTFVRRALERDDRFAVSSRIVTARDVSVGTPQSARSLEALDAVAATDASALPHVLVIGAPERLSTGDVRTLTRLMETWGRAVLLLPDHLPAGSSIVGMNTLLAVSAWRSLPAVPTSAPRRVVHAPAYPGDSVSLAASEAATPTVLPVDATPLATAGDAPVVWMRPVGHGLVVASSAFDVWRFRDAAQSTFDVTWRELVAVAAQDVGPALSLVPMSPPSVPPMALIRALVVTRDTDTNGAPPSATLVPETEVADSSSPPLQIPVPVPLLRTGRADTWLAQVRAPSAGLWQLRVTREGLGSETAVLPLHVTTHGTENARLATPSEQLAALSFASGGRLVSPQAIDSLPDLLETQLGLPRQSAPWRPMRSPWWILPLTLALGGDWWLRRRRGAR